MRHIDNKQNDKNINNEPKVQNIASDFNTMISYSGKIGGEMVRRMIKQQELKMQDTYNQQKLGDDFNAKR